MFRSVKTINLHNNVNNYSPLISLVSQFTCFSPIASGATIDCNSTKKYKIHVQPQYPQTHLNVVSCSTKVVYPESEVGLLKKVLTKVKFAGHSKSRLKAASYYLYENVADKVNYIEFFNEFNLPNTFNSWFLVTELHVWMLLLRSMAEGSEKGEDGRFLRNSIVEAMWADVNTRAKKLGANNPSGTRSQIEMLSEQFQAALMTYDEGIMSDDKVLAGALWRRFFEKNCEDYCLLEKLVLYVRQHVQMLDSLSREEFIVKQQFQWKPLKDIKI